MQMVLALIGLPRSGKDFAADYLSGKYGFRKINISDLIAVEAKKRKLPASKKGLSELGDKLRQEKGKGVMGRLVLSEIKKSKESLFVVSGFRTFESVKFLKKKLPVIVVKISSEKKLRFARNESEKKSDLEEREKIELSRKGMNLLLKKSDYTLENNDSKENFLKNLDGLMRVLLPKMRQALKL